MRYLNKSAKGDVMNEDIKHLLEMSINVLIISNGEISTDEGVLLHCRLELSYRTRNRFRESV